MGCCGVISRRHSRGSGGIVWGSGALRALSSNVRGIPTWPLHTCEHDCSNIGQDHPYLLLPPNERHVRFHRLDSFADLGGSSF